MRPARIDTIQPVARHVDLRVVHVTASSACSEVVVGKDVGRHQSEAIDQTHWDDLDRVYFLGFSLWIYLSTPFFLTFPGVAIEELPVWREEDWTRVQNALKPIHVAHRGSVVC